MQLGILNIIHIGHLHQESIFVPSLPLVIMLGEQEEIL